MSFFAPRGEFAPCGMFNVTHFIVLFICIIGIFLGLYFSYKLDNKIINKITKILAIIVTILELIKIIYNFYYKCFTLNYWFPLSFCSLFIYALWFTGFGKGKIKRVGEIFIVCGGIVSGLAFLIMPSTSLTEVPMFHYLSCYSMLFHSLMVYLGLLFLIKKIVIVRKKELIYYIIFCIITCGLAFIINLICKTNLMFLNDSYNIPIPLLKTIANNIPFLYTLIIILAYITFPYLISYGLSRLINKKNQ